ncbi:Spy/CpxP family protein refolding chaperone [Phenylobacterium sp.]|uniref:Spy/CpxP family protein refolding chaperone n=1 Tax=Phenylobacterium sp. TaxID=1871053 RepID=UPI00398365F4
MPAERLTALQDDLVLAPAQLPRWNAFADATQAMGKGMGMMQGSEIAEDMPMYSGTATQRGMPMPRSDHGAMMGQAGSLLERLDPHQSMLTAQLDAVRKVKSAPSPLSSALTLAQTAKFDAATNCGPRRL